MPAGSKGKRVSSSSQAAKSPTPTKREPWTPWGKWAKRRRERIEQRQREREEQLRRKRRARELRRQRRRRITARGGVFLGLIGLACGMGGVILLALGRPYPWEALADVTAVMRLSQTLDSQQARWESLAIRNYRIEVLYTSRDAVCGYANLEVREGRVVGQLIQGGDHWFPPDVCNGLVDRFTVDGAFRWIDSEIAAFLPGRSHLRADFDPAFGFPTHFTRTLYTEMLLTADCCWEALWRNLQPLSP